MESRHIDDETRVNQDESFYCEQKTIINEKLSIEEKYSYITMFVTLKEEAAALKEAALKEEALKEAALKEAALKEVERVLKEVERVLKEAAIKEKELLVTGLTKDLLQAKGLFTSRGIFEYILKLCWYELYPSDSTGKSSKKFNASAAANTIVGLLSLERPTTPYLQIMYDVAKECKCTKLSELYGVLSSEIHGYAWDTQSIVIYGDSLDPVFSCVLKKLCEEMHMQYTLGVMSS